MSTFALPLPLRPFRTVTQATSPVAEAAAAERSKEIPILEIIVTGGSHVFSYTHRSLFTYIEKVVQDIDSGVVSTEDHGITPLNQRDLRRLDPDYTLNQQTSLIIRRHAIIFAIDPIRAVILSDRILIALPKGASPMTDEQDNIWKVVRDQIAGTVETLLAMLFNEL